MEVDLRPRDAEATIDLTSQELRPYLRRAYDELEGQLCRFLEEARSSPVDWIVFDYAPYWVARVAARFGAKPWFSQVSPSSAQFYLSGCE